MESKRGGICSPTSMVVEDEVALCFIPREQKFGRCQTVPKTIGRAVAAARGVPKASQMIQKGRFHWTSHAVAAAKRSAQKIDEGGYDEAVTTFDKKR